MRIRGVTLSDTQKKCSSYGKNGLLEAWEHAHTTPFRLYACCLALCRQGFAACQMRPARNMLRISSTETELRLLTLILGGALSAWP